MSNPSVIVTSSLARRVREMQAARGDDGLMLRVLVNGGGCKGFEYGFDLTGTLEDGDAVFEKDGVKVVIDDVSLDLLAGSEIDFEDGLIGASFRIRNPNATSTCGCGTSFST